MECQIVRITESASYNLNLFTNELESYDCSAWSLDSFRMPTRIFKTGLNKISFVSQSIGTSLIDRCAEFRMIADDNVNATIRAEGNLVWSMLSRCALKLEQELGFFQLAIAIFIHESVQAGALGSVTRHVNVAIERKYPLYILDKFAIDTALFRCAILVRIVNQKQWPTFLRSHDVTKLIERHCNNGTDRSVVNHFVHYKSRLGLESF